MQAKRLGNQTPTLSRFLDYDVMKGPEAVELYNASSRTTHRSFLSVAEKCVLYFTIHSFSRNSGLFQQTLITSNIVRVLLEEDTSAPLAALKHEQLHD